MSTARASAGQAGAARVDAAGMRFAQTPEPPYYLVSFTSLRDGGDAGAYADAAERMLTLAAQQPGFLGAESVRDADGVGITLSYWRNETDILAWKHHGEHAATRARGRSDWYARFSVRVARVERAYDWARPGMGSHA